MITFSVRVVPVYEAGRSKDYYFVEWDDPKGLHPNREALLLADIFQCFPIIEKVGVSVIGDYASGRYVFPSIVWVTEELWCQKNHFSSGYLLPGDYKVTGAVFTRLDQADQFKIYLEKKLLMIVLTKEYT